MRYYSKKINFIHFAKLKKRNSRNSLKNLFIRLTRSYKWKVKKFSRDNYFKDFRNMDRKDYQYFRNCTREEKK